MIMIVVEGFRGYVMFCHSCHGPCLAPASLQVELTSETGPGDVGVWTAVPQVVFAWDSARCGRSSC